MKFQLACASVALFLQAAPAHAFSYISYANEFVDPAYILGDSWKASTTWAQQGVLYDAQYVGTQGPWTVTNKTFLAPTNDTHDYVSIRPYFWPDCSQVGNTTALTDQQVWTTCPYVNRDGLFNPDARMVNDTGKFQAMSDSVFYNALSWAITKDSKYSTSVAQAISTWFLNETTLMNPNLNFAQLLRGPGQWNASNEGVLDLKCMSKLVTGVMVLRNGNAAEWTSAIDAGLVAWTKQYIVWLTTSALALEEKAAKNNHGSFYFNQLASLQLLVGDTAGAKATVMEYFETLYQNQIIANGDQPLESARTRPYHYRAYNLVAMIVNARIGAVVGYNAWNVTTKAGVTIQAAADYAMTLPPTGEENYVEELFQPVAAVASAYGDPQGKYAAFLKSKDPEYPAQPYFLYAQGLSDSGLKAPASVTQSSGVESSTGTSNSKGAADAAHGINGLAAILAVAVALFSF